MRKYKFTNVYRELDRVTIWIRQHIREPYAKDPHLWFMLCMARQINHPETLREIIYSNTMAWPKNNKWKSEVLLKMLRDRAARGEKVYTGAYIINAAGGAKGEFDKPFVTAQRALKQPWDARHTVDGAAHHSMQNMVEWLMQFNGWGRFMAYEVACDMRYTRYLQNAKDRNTWAGYGPGALRGMGRLLGRYPKAREMLPGMLELREKIAAKWEYLPQLEMREIEHSLCEFDKYERARLGEGRPKSIFVPTTNSWKGN
jgi:hypothetical protein